MLLNLMVYVLTVSLFLGLAAWAFDRAVRVFGFPTRWIWAGAMGGSLGYILLAILRPPAASLPLETGAGTPLDALLTPVIGSITRFADPSTTGVSLEMLLGVVWAALTLAVAAVLGRAHLRLRSDQSTWTPSELDGRDVLVSEDLGPGVVGWIRSVIVMPRWAFAMPPEERELMLRHEGEHCNAGDTRVAGLALLLLTLFPWNLPLWWQVHRLRLAIEIDCDHRVLHRSADVKRYARLLIEIGARGTASRLSALAFARPTPSIERRILAMTDTPDDPRYVRTVGLTLLSAVLVVASCQVEQPRTTVGAERFRAEASLDAIDGAERIVLIGLDDVGIEVPPPGAAADPPAIQGQQEILRLTGQEVSEEEILNRLAESGLTRAQVRSQLTSMGIDPSIADAYFDRLEEEQEIRPEDRAAIQEGPVFTPMTVRPEIRNRREVQEALIEEYPSNLRSAGIGGQVVVWYYISKTGQVLHSRVSESSGQADLDAAALRVAVVFRFTPAMNRNEPVPVWIQLPITFGAP